MPFLKANGVRYHFHVEGEGEPLLLLHGFTGCSENWSSQVDAFTRRYQLIRIDLLGHGKSEAPQDADRYQMEESAEDIATLINGITTPPVHLLGYSMGGRLALFVALARPALVKSLILESASPGLKTEAERQERRKKDSELALAIERDGIPSFVDQWEQLPLFASQSSLPPEARRTLREQRLHNSATGLANSLRGMGTGRQPSLWGRLPELDVPLLVLVGEFDLKFRRIAGELVRLVPRAQLHVVPGAGHIIHMENPGFFEASVMSFINRELEEKDKGGER